MTASNGGNSCNGNNFYTRKSNDNSTATTTKMQRSSSSSSSATTPTNKSGGEAHNARRQQQRLATITATSTTTPTTTTSSLTPTSLPSTTRQAEGKRNLYEFLCIVVACTLCYYNSTQCGLVFDDISAIRDNRDLRASTPLRNIFLNDFWGTPMRKEQSHKSYRPLTVLTFRLNYWWHELQPYGYHAFNVLLHIVVCLLWRRVCRLLLRQCSAGANNRQCNGGGVVGGGSGEVNTQTSAAQWQRQNDCSFVAAMLFAVHPIHTEAVTGVVGRAELLSSIFYLAAFLAYASAVVTVVPSSSSSSLSAARRRAGIAGASTTRWSTLCGSYASCLLASMLCKEQGITIAGICAAYELCVIQQLRPLQLWHCVQQFFDEPKITSSPSSSGAAKPSTPGWRPNGSLGKRLTFLVCLTAALLCGRLYVMGSQLPVFTRFDNPASAAPSPARQLTYSYLIYLNSWLLLFPSQLCCDWTMGTIPLLESFGDARNLATLLTFAFLAALVRRACFAPPTRQTRALLMCLAWLVLPFLPASNLFFPVGFVVAERILYMPSMGFCLLIACGYTQLQQRLQQQKSTWSRAVRRLCKLMLGVLLVAHALKSHQRNVDWRTEYTLFMSGVHVNANNAKLFNNVGHALENEARYADALRYFQQAVRIQNDDIGAHINVGRTYNNLKLYDEAERAYLRAKALFPKIKPGESYQARIAPNHLNVFINLANLIAKNQTRLEEADHLYRQAISMRADYVQAYINRGDILMKLNRTAQAQEVYEKALLYDSENADIYYNLGVVFLEQGKSAQAHVYFNRAIELFPEHEQALLNSAILLQELGGTEARRLSRERLYKVLLKDADNEKVYFNLGMLAMDETNFDEAEQYFKRAIHLKANFRSALFNLALLLADTNRPLEAVPYLNQLIRHHPDHIKGLILLGDIYINHMKDLDAAESCYHSILQFEPHNIQGLHNLCVVYVERKRLAKAHACLRYARHLAPGEDYIQRHLEIVETRLRKIAKLAETSAERQSAYADYDPMEFQLPGAAPSPRSLDAAMQQQQRAQQTS